jgi:hypothetical protein
MSEELAKRLLPTPFRKTALSRTADLHPPKMLHDSCMAAMRKLHCGGGRRDEWQEWAVNDEAKGPFSSTAQRDASAV